MLWCCSLAVLPLWLYSINEWRVGLRGNKRQEKRKELLKWKRDRGVSLWFPQGRELKERGVTLFFGQLLSTWSGNMWVLVCVVVSIYTFFFAPCHTAVLTSRHFWCVWLFICKEISITSRSFCVFAGICTCVYVCVCSWFGCMCVAGKCFHLHVGVSLFRYWLTSRFIDPIRANNGDRSSATSTQYPHIHIHTDTQLTFKTFHRRRGQTPSGLCTFYSKSSAVSRGIHRDMQVAFRDPSGETDR